MRTPTIASTLFLALAPAWPWVQTARAQAEKPEGFEQVIPRGRIASVDDPRYVSADEADIRDEAWVLGVVIEGQARAYSLDLLNAHEVVNDSIGGVNFAAVW